MAGTYSSTGGSHRKLSDRHIAIVVARWNEDVTEALYEGAESTLLRAGIRKKNIVRQTVPGSFELPLAAQALAAQQAIDAVICLGCVIQGETPHFTFISDAVAHGIMDVGLRARKPVVFGVLTTLNKQQAIDRAGGKVGNKGEEAALTALELLGA